MLGDFTLPASFLAPLALVGPISAGNVLVVDASGSGFTQIQPAIDAARDGDTILVRSGTYPRFWIVDRDLDVVADTGQTVNINGSVEVRFQSYGHDVLLSGLRIDGAPDLQFWSGVGLRLKNNMGAVRVQDCVLRGTMIYPNGGARPGATVENCTNVAFTGCTVRGSDVWALAVTGGNGLESSGSALAVDDCSITGGQGGWVYNAWSCLDCYAGGNGVVVDSFLFDSGSRFTGGVGASADTTGCCANSGGPGGAGLTVQTAGGEVILVASALFGGFGGYGDCCSVGCDPDGPDGLPMTGTAQILTGPARAMTLPAVVRDPSGVPVTVDGVPGDLVWVRIARNTDFDHRPSLSGVQLTEVGPLSRTIELGPIPPSGSLATWIDFPPPRPRLPRGEMGYTGAEVSRSTVLHLQALVHPASGPDLLGGARSIVLLD